MIKVSADINTKKMLVWNIISGALFFCGFYYFTDMDFGFDYSLEVIIAIIVFFVFGLFMMKNNVKDMVDEAWVDGDKIFLRKKEIKEEIHMSDIKRMEYMHSGPSPKMEIHLKMPCKFGMNVSISPKTNYNPFIKNKDLEEFIRKHEKNFCK